MINHLLLRRNEELWYRGLVPRMTERATNGLPSRESSSQRTGGRKPPNEVRTGGEVGGDGKRKGEISHALNSDFAADILQKCLLEGLHLPPFLSILWNLRKFTYKYVPSHRIPRNFTYKSAPRGFQEAMWKQAVGFGFSGFSRASESTPPHKSDFSSKIS